MSSAAFLGSGRALVFSRRWNQEQVVNISVWRQVRSLVEPWIAPREQHGDMLCCPSVALFTLEHTTAEGLCCVEESFPSLDLQNVVVCEKISREMDTSQPKHLFEGSRAGRAQFWLFCCCFFLFLSPLESHMVHLAEDSSIDLCECAHKPAFFLSPLMCPVSLS